MLTGQKVILTSIERYDLPKNYLWGNNRELIRLSGISPFPKSSWQIEKWYEQSLTNPATMLLAIRNKAAEYIGNIELSNIDFKNSRAEIGILIGEKDFQNKGYGSDALKTIIEFGFKELNLNRLYARVLSFNQAGIKLFKDADFVEEGREREAFYSEGKYWDILLFSKLRNDKKARTARH